jgi:ComF family protein
MKGLADPSSQSMLDFGEQVQSMARAALDLLFPRRCVTCRRVGHDLCPDCIAGFVAVGDSICRICGEPQAAPGVCRRCLASPPAFKCVRSAFRFEGGIRRAIHGLKYNGCRGVAVPLAAAIAERIPIPSQASVMCPVPLHAERQAERGYNQARLLAQELARNWRISCLPEHALRRTRPTGSQVGLDYAARQDNVRDAFSADEPSVTGRIIVVVDDVCTTGATINACAQVLLDAGAALVLGVTLARASSSGKSA